MEATLSAVENCLRTADAKGLKGSSPMLMEFLTPIFHIFSDLIVKMTPSSSISPTGPPSEDRSVNEQIRDLERQVALSEGKLQESQRSTITKPSYAQVASLPENVTNFTIAPPPSEKVLLVRPLESKADSSTTRNKKNPFLLNKNLPFRITRIKHINNGGIAICLTTDEDVNKLSQELSKNADFASFSVSKPTLRKPQFILFGVNSPYNKDSITKALLLKKCSTVGSLGHTRNHCSNTQACIRCSSTDDHDQTSCNPRCINCTTQNARFRSGFPENHGCRDKNCPVLIQFRNRTIDRTDYGR
ncbi:uncharacterized protein TNCT_9931 [Trichonephila clavata]|uniref:Gag-like protein n=1 Tax=Trichonephila clavata TaxID=2740835 RepID=A0A8X6LGG6_TRICU|nr:uncharacterized protein TNCT_9931 [Trichonephila clavata]